MNAELLVVTLFLLCVITIAICITIYNIKEEQIRSDERKLAMQHGYEQQYATDHVRSDNYAWVKVDKAGKPSENTNLE